MPDWKIHLIFGCLLSVFWFNIFYFGNIFITPLKQVILLSMSLFSTIFADIDISRSKIRGLISLIVAFGISSMYIFFYRETWFYAPFYFLILYFLLRYIPSKHRGFTHSFKFSILFSFLLTLLCYFFLSLTNLEFIFWFGVILLSYNIHLILDKI